MRTFKLNWKPLRPALLTFLLAVPSLLCPTTSSGAAGTVIAWGGNSNGQTNVPLDLTNAVAVATGEIQSLAIRRDGTLAAWGGDSTSLTNVPAGISNVVQVAGGGTHGLVLRADGSVVGWGDNNYPDTNSPTGQATPPADLANAVGIAAGWAHSVALRYDQTVVAWGCNNYGQTNVPANLGPVMAVAAGDWFSAALRNDGTVVAWGDNSLGQTNVPAGLSNVVAIAARGGTMLALTQDGQAVAWGDGSLGQTNVPSDLTNAVAIATGGAFELALRDDGRVVAWGDNGSGEIDGAAGLARVTVLAAGGAHGVALLGDGAPHVTLQPRNQAAAAGSNVTFVVKAVGDPFLSYQWRKDGLDLTNTINLSGASTPTLSLTNLAGTDAGEYSVVVSNLSGVVTSTVAALTILSSAVADSFNPGPNGYVYALAVQPDGKILVGGTFSTLAHQTCNCLGRLNADGSLDTAFDMGVRPEVDSIAVQSDGNILVGGTFTTIGGQSRTNLGRLKPDGSVDPTFNPGALGISYLLAPQPDGKIVVGGDFATLAGKTCRFLGRLNPDGNLDASFSPAPSAQVYALALQTDGKILVGGLFTSLAGQTRNGIGRLNADGSLDAEYDPEGSIGVYSLAVQADGKVVLGGIFTTLAGQARNRIARLNSDGSLDTGFNPGANGKVSCLALQADGKILVAGSFSTLAGRTCKYIGRLNPDGSLDPTFNPGAVGNVYALAIQADGRVLASGAFSSLGSQPRSYLGRLYNTAPAVESMRLAGSTVTWSRGGTGPEVWRSAFDASTNGMDWFSLGPGMRILGGWQETGTLLPTNTTIRARGFCTGGQDNGSGWFVETSIGPPAITQQPVNVASLTNTAVTFSVSAAGLPTLAYQWCKNSAAIADATNSVFTIQSAVAGDAGSYQVVVTNGFGAVTSVVATLRIVNPALPDPFNPGVGGVTLPVVYSLARQSDGKVLVGGFFLTLGGQRHVAIGRVNTDGSLDNGFNGVIPNSSGNPAVYCVTPQTDGKLLVGGNFGPGAGPPNYLFRLNADGSWDKSLTLAPDGAVYCLAQQADGKILAGGNFTTLDGVHTSSRLGRFNADGSWDSTFNPQVGAAVTPTVYSLAIQPDGKILVGGFFATLGGQWRYNLGRLNADGSLDASFNPNVNGWVYALALQADGKILVGGNFTTIGGQSRSRLGRLNADGSLDVTFSPAANSTVYSLAVQTDGKILLGGQFTTLCGQSQAYLGRLNADGSLDTTFTSGAGNYVYSLAVQPDGEVLVGGAFSTLGGQPRNRLGRLSNTEPATESLTFNTSTVTWLRGGTGPEAWRTTFDVCTNGTDWTNLGAGTRIPGGWQQTGLSLPTNVTIRARGFCTAGEYNGSGFLVETLVGAPVITCQPANISNFTNSVMGFSVTAVGTPPIAYQWYKSGAAITDATNLAYTIQSSAAGDAGSYCVVLSNSFGMVTSAVATLTILTPVSADAFNPGAGGVSFPSVSSFAVQPDGKIMVGGSFSTLAGQTCSNLGRLNADGSLEIALNADEPAPYLPWVYSLALQPDGKTLVGGAFTMLAGQPRTYLGRFNGDGSLDTAFNPYIPGAGQGVLALAVQPDGKILVGGNFTALAGQPRSNLGRLNPNGSLDPDFNPQANNVVYSLAVQPDGMILVAGAFTGLGGWNHGRVARLYPDGTLDTSFNPVANDTVRCVAVQPDGRILLGGFFTTLASQSRTNLGRLNADGTLDAGFNPGTGGVSSPSVHSLALQTDGKILVGGYFATLGGQTCNHLGRLNPNGSLDPTFNPTPNLTVSSVAVQADGKILVGGAFTNLAGQTRNYVGRLANTEPATQSLSFDGATVTWLRGATGPEAWRTTFDACTNGTDWISLGAGTRITSGWQQTGLSLPAGATIRARGFCLGGAFDGSSWYVETGLGRAAISQQPTSRTNNAGTIAQFVAQGAGTSPLSCQWRKGGVLLSDNGNISGSQTATLTLTNVLGADAGSYSVIITNSNGSVTSQVATLSVVDPFISAQPVSQTADAGATLLFSATAAGTESLRYQWRRNGLNVAGGTEASLTLTNVQWANAGGFDLLVSNSFGMVTSVVATLSVNGPVIPVNDGSFGPHTNGFGFNVGCMPGEAVVIEASTNLVDWGPVQTNLVTSEGIFLFVDRDKSIYQRRFYRARLYAGALPAPAIDLSTGALSFPTNPFGFDLCGVAGQTAVIEASTNLLIWMPLATNRLGTDPLYFSDPASTNLSQRFYRAVLVP
ncbi:MAG: immunoglobulin domain-containing protein [Verrucomicrobiota bacterium]